MVTYNEHLKKILSQTLESYNILRQIQDKPGDLDNIKKEMLKINGFLKVVTNNIDEYKISLQVLSGAQISAAASGKLKLNILENKKIGLYLWGFVGYQTKNGHMTKKSENFHPKNI